MGFKKVSSLLKNMLTIYNLHERNVCHVLFHFSLCKLCFLLRILNDRRNSVVLRIFTDRKVIIYQNLGIQKFRLDHSFFLSFQMKGREKKSFIPPKDGLASKK